MRYKYKSCQKCALFRSSVDADHLKKMYFKHIINDNATATHSSIPSIASVQSQSSHVNTQSPENIPPLQHPLLHLPHNSLQGLPQPPLLLLCNLTDHLLRSTASLNTTPSFTRPRPSTTSTCTVTLNILFNPAKWDRMYLPTAPYSDTTRLFQRCLKKTSSCPDHFHLVTVTPESQP